MIEAVPRDELVKALAAVYRDYPLAIARLCDDHLDPGGALLGYVRDEARPRLSSRKRVA